MATGTQSAPTTVPAAALTLSARFEKPKAGAGKIPEGLIARCALTFMHSPLSHVELNGFGFWKDAKTGSVTMSWPGSRFPDLKPAVCTGEVKGKEISYVDPDGDAELGALGSGLMAGFLAWQQSGQERQGVTINTTPAK